MIKPAHALLNQLKLSAETTKHHNYITSFAVPSALHKVFESHLIAIRSPGMRKCSVARNAISDKLGEAEVAITI